MSTIRVIYHPNPDGSRRQPNFPATDQHPNAVRYPFDHPTFGLLTVDAIGGAPTLAEIDALLGVDAAGQAEQARKAAIDAAISGDATIAQLKAMDNAAFDAWWSANVTNLAQANNVLKRIARVVLRRLA